MISPPRSVEPRWVTDWRERTPGAGLADYLVREMIEVDRDLPQQFLWHERPGVSLDGMALEGPADQPELVLLFRAEEERPGCRFGKRLPLRRLERNGVFIDIFMSGIEEMLDLDELPRACRPGEITWL